MTGGSAGAGILVGAVRAYQWVVRPLCGPACRFEPVCSEYAIEAIRRHGAGRGSALALGRVLRCHPWGACGHDPVPAARAPGDRAPSTQHRAERDRGWNRSA